MDIIQTTKVKDALRKKIADGEYPEVIYKFRQWNDEPKDHILRKRTVRLSKPSEMFAEYPEAILPIDMTYLEEDKLMEYALHVAKCKYPTKHISFQKMKSKRIRSRLKIEDPEHRKEALIKHRQINDKYLGILCCTMDFSDLYMWNEFGERGKGFAVGLKTLEVVCHPKIMGTCAKVDYYNKDNIPTVPPFTFTFEESINKVTKQIFSIPDYYKQEKEFRISKTNCNSITAKPEDYSDEDRNIILEEICFHEIILGPKIPEKDKLEILKTRDKLLSNTPIFTTELIDSLVSKRSEI